MGDGAADAITDELTPIERFGVRELLLVLALALVAVPFALLVYEVRRRHGALVDADLSVARWLHVHIRGNRPLTVAMETLSFVGSGWFVTCVVAVPVVWLLRRGTRRAAVFLVATSVGGSLLNTIVKGAVGRARPVFADPIAIALGKSFPSGHAMGALVCYGAVLVAVLPFMRRGIRTPIVVATGALVATIGFSRVALGVHYLSDVIGGFVLGAAWLLGSVALFNVWRREASEER